MCDPTFPIFRCGSILESKHNGTAELAVELGRKLQANSQAFTNELIAFLQGSVPEFKGGRPARVTKGSPTRIRLHPTIIIDHPPVQFEFEGLTIDARVCMTTWTGRRKAKIWVRYSAVEIQSDKRVIARYFEALRGVADKVQKFAEEYYFSLLREHFNLAARTVFRIYIRMVSSPKDELKAEIEKAFAPGRQISQKEMLAYAERLLGSEFDLKLPQLPMQADNKKRFIKTFRYPVDSMDALSERSDIEFVSDLDSLVFMGLAGNDQVQCICVVDIDEGNAEVYGIVYETKPPRSFTNAATQIASAELSYQLGELY